MQRYQESDVPAARAPSLAGKRHKVGEGGGASTSGKPLGSRGVNLINQQTYSTAVDDSDDDLSIQAQKRLPPPKPKNKVQHGVALNGNARSPRAASLRAKARLAGAPMPKRARLGELNIKKAQLTRVGVRGTPVWDDGGMPRATKKRKPAVEDTMPVPEEDEDAGESSAAEIQVVHASKAKKARKTEVLVLEDSDNELLPAPFKPAAPVQPEPVEPQPMRPAHSTCTCATCPLGQSRSLFEDEDDASGSTSDDASWLTRTPRAWSW
ncbi:hypothetical protein JCM8208_003563 [Rhodotorula glutinis]